MQLEAQHVNRQRYHNQRQNARAPVAQVGAHRHLEVAKLVPQILHRVQADERRRKQAHHLDTRHTPDRRAGEKEPEPPRFRKRLVLQTVETHQAQHDTQREQKQHRVQQNEARDRQPAIVEQHHQRKQVLGAPIPVHRLRGEVGHRHHQNPIDRHQNAHADERHLLRIVVSRFKLKVAVKTAQHTRQAHQDLAQRGMHVKVEHMADVVRAKLAKMRLVPHHLVVTANPVQTRNDRQQRIHRQHHAVVLQVRLDLFPGRHRRTLHGDKTGVLGHARRAHICLLVFFVHTWHPTRGASSVHGQQSGAFADAFWV